MYETFACDVKLAVRIKDDSGMTGSEAFEFVYP
jgi:hypothetical protein